MRTRCPGRSTSVTEEGLSDADVVALRFDEPNAAADLAAWCDGEVTHLVGDPHVVVILVPSVDHARPAQVGDWIVRERDGRYRVYDPASFAANFEPSL
jgi:hypothetical protein